MLVCINGVRNEHDDDSIGDGLGLDIDNDDVNMLRVLIASRVMRVVSDWAIVLESCRLLFCYGRCGGRAAFAMYCQCPSWRLSILSQTDQKAMIIKNLAFIVAAIVASAAALVSRH